MSCGTTGGNSDDKQRNDDGATSGGDGEKGMDKLVTEGILECPLCLEEFDGRKRVYQCLDGHTICETCYNSSPASRQRCATCRAEMPKMKVRNKLAEEVGTQASALGLLRDNASSVGPIPQRDRTKKKRTGSKSASGSAQKKRKLNKTAHAGVYCHNPACTNSGSCIEGIRYKCMECNMDFCESCQKAGIHNHHLLARIATPNTALAAYNFFTKWQALKVANDTTTIGGAATATTCDGGTTGGPAPAFTGFGSPPVATTASTSFTGFGAPAASNFPGQTASPGFSFGAPAPTSTTTTQGLNTGFGLGGIPGRSTNNFTGFGAPTTTTASTSLTGFGAPAASSFPGQTASPGFSFGAAAPTSTTNPTSTPSFWFG